MQGYARSGESIVQVLDEVVLVGVTHVFARLSMDDTPPDVARETIQLPGREVIPRFT